MTSPHNTGQKGQVGQEHDGRPDASHEKEVAKAESNRGGEESGREESGTGTDLKHSND